MSDPTEAPVFDGGLAAPIGDGPSDSGLFPGGDPSDSAVVQVGPLSGSGVVVQADAPATIATPDFDRAFRQEVADKILDVLVKAYGSRREHVLAAASERGVSVEHLLSAYLARVLMDKVDREYL